MTIEEIYKWAVENECENDILKIVDWEGRVCYVRGDMITAIGYKGSCCSDEVLISVARNARNYDTLLDALRIKKKG